MQALVNTTSEEDFGEPIAYILKRINGDLKEVLVGKAQGRTSVPQMVLFKSVGTAVQDVMAGFVVYEEAVRQGRGQDIGEFLDLKTF